MKGHRTWILAAGLALLACNRGEPLKEPPQKDTPSTQPAGAPNAAAPAVNDPTVAKINARATVETGEAANESTAEVALNVSRAGIVSGTFTLAGTPLSVRGTRQEGEIRLWVNGQEGSEDTVRRGYMIGTVTGGRVEGTFAISGNAGTPALKGSWHSEN